MYKLLVRQGKCKGYKKRKSKKSTDRTSISQYFRQPLSKMEVLTGNNYLAEIYRADVSQFLTFCLFFSCFGCHNISIISQFSNFQLFIFLRFQFLQFHNNLA